MQQWPVPKTLKELHGFCLIGYYRKFVKNYAQLAAPLTALLCKDAYKWTIESHQSFKGLKGVMTSNLVLALSDFLSPFTIETNASGRGVGCVLMQRTQHVAYFSQALSKQNQHKSTYECELIAIVLAVEKWRHYFIHLPFTIKTKQYSLKHLLTQKQVQEPQSKWLYKLLGY